MRYLSVFILGLVVTAGGFATAAEPPIAMAVKADRLFGSDPGVLTVTEEGLMFEAREAAETRRWGFDAVRHVRIPSARQIVVETYEPTKRFLVIPGLRTYTFNVVEGSVTPEFVAVLLQQFPRPIVTTVMPRTCDAMWSGTAWHDRRRSGHDGVLELHCGGLMFHASSAAANRYWRFQDVASVLRLDANRLEVTVRESGGLEPYVFELKGDLPEAVFEAIWRRLHPATEWTGEPTSLQAERGVR